MKNRRMLREDRKLANQRKYYLKEQLRIYFKIIPNIRLEEDLRQLLNT